MNLYFMHTASKSFVVAGGNRTQAMRIGQTYVDDLDTSNGGTRIPIVGCVKLDIPESACVIATTGIPA